jgi:hypothetical protein
MRLLMTMTTDYFPIECGRPGERSYPLRIVNGTVVRINDYPW